MSHWKTFVVEGNETVPVYHWLVWIGVLQRGDPKKFWMQELPVTVSSPEPRIPPLKQSQWVQICNTLFTPDSNIVLQTDSAAAYATVDHVGIVDRHAVNHSKGEFSRSTVVLSSARTRQLRAGMAGTMSLDQEWRRLKEHLPDNLSGRTEKGRHVIAGYFRMAQWLRWHRNADRWCVLPNLPVEVLCALVFLCVWASHD